MTSDGPVVQSSPKSAGAFQLQVSPGLSRLSPEKGCTRNSLFVQDERRLAKSSQLSSVLHGSVFRSKSIGIGLQCSIPPLHCNCGRSFYILYLFQSFTLCLLLDGRSTPKLPKNPTSRGVPSFDTSKASLSCPSSARWQPPVGRTSQFDLNHDNPEGS